MMIFENLKLFIKSQNITAEKEIGKFLTEHSMTVATTESCTGGLVSSRLTDIAGSSLYIKENYVTYANEAKMKLLGVTEETLKNYGAVSTQCAKEMAEGLFKATGADFALATTGIAGPGGGSDVKPVGLMFIGLKSKNNLEIKEIKLNPKYDRRLMKFLFSQAALDSLLDFITGKN
jgi:PncC family amidohydrolase